MLSFLSAARRPCHQFLKPCRHSSTLTLPADAVESSPSTPVSVSTPRDLLRQRRFYDLTDSLTHGGSPSRVWSNYTNLLNFMGYEKLPLEIHQQVLRQCTPPTAQLRTAATRRILVGNSPATPHIHEGRFQTIIRTIRSFEMKPALDDYNFILEQFAAVGHYLGAMHVYRELRQLGLIPVAKTYTLCLQAIGHRLTLPVKRGTRPHMVEQCRKSLGKLTSEMQSLNIPFTAVNVDLTMRILKEMIDMEGFEALMRWAYGIDLSNPDRTPLEYMGLNIPKSGFTSAEKSIPPLPSPLSFSTAALNTTIDMLGRLGDVSKLIQTFEVLTMPLPNAGQHQFASFDDDDFGTTDGFVAPKFTPPHAPPNTTTYNILLRHLSQGGHTALARHYLVQAIYLDRRFDHRLRITVMTKPIDQVHAPRFALNRGTLLSVYGVSNRDKNAGLMRWLASKIPRIIKRKQSSLDFFTRLRDQLLSQNKPIGPSQGSSKIVKFWTSEARSTPSVFDLDVDAALITPAPNHVKLLDLNTHIQVLERDLKEIGELERRVTDVLGRTTQRIKERLGRRVWLAKNVYLRSASSRRLVSRPHWQKIVNFRSRRPNTVLPRLPPYFARDPVERRVFSTMSTSLAQPLHTSCIQPSPPGLPSHLEPGCRIW